MKKTIALAILLILAVSAISLISTTKTVPAVPMGCNNGVGWQLCLTQCESLMNLQCFKDCCNGIANTYFIDTVQVVTPQEE